MNAIMNKSMNIYLVNIFPACSATHVTWCHETNTEGFIPGFFTLRDLGRIEVRGIVLIQYLTLRHFGSLINQSNQMYV